MSLASGTRLGPYEIVALIGAGGMGEVYKARDTRLDRTVAIKVLPTEAAADPERRRRFEQEARAVSALNHPHICALFDVGEHVPSGPLPLAPVHYLVMEYLEGQTLAHRLRKGPMALEQALALGAQIAEALSAAHKLGIVHRDLKPANVMLTKASGALQAKLLDFGLARRSAANTQFRAGLSALSTEGPATTPGAVMGTVPYMAPEQLEGKAADARTDLFAFGCVLYEMLTGRRAFPGDSEASVISAIMTSEPAPLRSLQPVAPPALERLVTACLAKDPDERRQSAHDVADDLRGIAQGAPASSRAPARRRRDWLLGAAPSLIVVLAGALGWAAWQAWWRPAAVPVRADIAMPGGTQFAGTYVGVAFAPNGNGLVYRAADPAGARFYWQPLDGSPPQVVPGTEQGAQPFFSPDAKHLGFTQRSKLVTLALPAGPPGDGGPIEPLADVGGMRGASWGEDGTILYTPRPLDGLWRVSANGGDARELTRPDPAKSEMSHRWPSFLPGGRAALFTILHLSGRQDRSAIGVLSLDTGRWTRIIDRGTRARYLPTGHVVYACKGALLAVRFDIKTLATIGRPTQVAKGVEMEWSGAAGDAWFDVSQSGALVFAPESYVPTNRSLVWLDRRGQVDPVTGDQRAYSVNLALSPDGQTLAGSAY